MIILTISFAVPQMTFISLYIQDGKTPLYVATKHDYSEIVQLLLKANANTDIANNVSCLILYNYYISLLNTLMFIKVFAFLRDIKQDHEIGFQHLKL